MSTVAEHHRPISPSLLGQPPEITLHIATYLRAYDLASLEQTCRFYHDRDHVENVVRTFATSVYPPDLTDGFETAPPLFEPKCTTTTTTTTTRGSPSSSSSKSSSGGIRLGGGGGKDDDGGGDGGPGRGGTTTRLITYETLRDMEMLVLLRVLNRPEPMSGPPSRRTLLLGGGGGGSATGGSMNDDDGKQQQQQQHFYVSKSWCKAALKWLEIQEESRRDRQPPPSLQPISEQSSRVGGGGSGGGTTTTSRASSSSSSSKQKKVSKKKQRLRERRLSDVSPPWPDINHDLLCPHENLRRCNSKSARAKRRLMDRQAWKVLRKLYPDSTALAAHSAGGGSSDECLQCLIELESAKREDRAEKDRRTADRKKPLANPLIRGLYVRGSRGIPQGSLSVGATTTTIADTTLSPLKPGVYHALPRSWCHGWRKYLKTGCEDSRLDACRPPDASVMLCDAHKLPLVPPHLERYLRGETPGLLSVSSSSSSFVAAMAGSSMSDGGLTSSDATKKSGVAAAQRAAAAASCCHRDGEGTTNAVGLLDHDVAVAASVAFGSGADLSLEIENQFEQMRLLGLAAAAATTTDVNDDGRRNGGSRSSYYQPLPPRSPLGPTAAGGAAGGGDAVVESSSSSTKNDLLDRENKVVVEIVTDEEFTALEEAFWPEYHGGCFTLKFAITEGSSPSSSSSTSSTTRCCSDVIWSTPPCRECDAAYSVGDKVVVRNRSRAWLKMSDRR